MIQRRNDSQSLEILEELGYSKSLAEKRVKIYHNAGKGVSLFETVKFGVDFEVVIAGSRGDGTGIYVDCDADKILVQNNVRCFEKEGDITDISNSTLFILETTDVPDGYAKLRFISKAEKHSDEIHNNILDALEETNGTLYLRNDNKLSPAIGISYIGDNWGWIEKNLVHAQMKSGPSKPYKIQVPFLFDYIVIDDVLSFRCDYPSATDNWCSRERKHDWPSKDLIDKVRNLDVFVVPVGAKGSENEHLQWRICLTLAELVLVQSFTDIQIKVYGALKMIAKHYLTPICDNITSYILKTVMFWQMEETNSDEWNTENFEERLKNALIFLKTCIREEQLPNYMTPARNMLLNKIPETAKQDLADKIDSLLKQSPYAQIRYITLNNLTKQKLISLTQEQKRPSKETSSSPLGQEQFDEENDTKQNDPLVKDKQMWPSEETVLYKREKGHAPFEEQDNSQVRHEQKISLNTTSLSPTEKDQVHEDKGVTEDCLPGSARETILQRNVKDCLPEAAREAILQRNVKDCLPEAVREAILQRNVREEFVLSILSLPPTETAALLKQVFEAKEESEVIRKISENALPYIRAHNPFEFFTNIVTMDDSAIQRKCIGDMSDKPSCILL